MAKWKLGLISLARRVISAKPAKKRGRRKKAKNPLSFGAMEEEVLHLDLLMLIKTTDRTNYKTMASTIAKLRLVEDKLTETEECFCSLS